MKAFKLNGKTITPQTVTFNTVCDLEDRGFDITDLDKRTMSFIRVFVAIWGNMSNEEAGILINDHMVNGGNLDVLMEAITDAINESGFFNREKAAPKQMKITEVTGKDS